MKQFTLSNGVRLPIGRYGRSACFGFERMIWRQFARALLQKKVNNDGIV